MECTNWKTLYNERWAEILGYTLAELEPINDETWLNWLIQMIS
jgi:PAS domain-containing protein